MAWLLHLTSRCQNRTITEQLQDGVRLFNLQVCRYRGEWHISHGLCIYEEKLFDVLDRMKKYKGIVFQLYRDKNLFVGQDEGEFASLVGYIKRHYCSPDFIMQLAWVEGTDKYPHKTGYKLNIEERYWTRAWAANHASSWLDHLPLPRYHAKRCNRVYKKSCKGDYLMLDFYEYE